MVLDWDHHWDRQVFTNYEDRKGNAETERMMRSLKEELFWPPGFDSLEAAQEAIGNWLGLDFNQRYILSALGYKSPVEFEAALREQRLVVAQAA